MFANLSILVFVRLSFRSSASVFKYIHPHMCTYLVLLAYRSLRLLTPSPTILRLRLTISWSILWSTYIFNYLFLHLSVLLSMFPLWRCSFILSIVSLFYHFVLLNFRPSISSFTYQCIYRCLHPFTYLSIRAFLFPLIRKLVHRYLPLSFSLFTNSFLLLCHCSSVPCFFMPMSCRPSIPLFLFVNLFRLLCPLASSI